MKYLRSVCPHESNIKCFMLSVIHLIILLMLLTSGSCAHSLNLTMTMIQGGHFVHLVFVCLFIHVFYNAYCLGKLRHTLFKWHRAPRSLHRRSTVCVGGTDSMLKLQGSSQYINLFIFSPILHQPSVQVGVNRF